MLDETQQTTSWRSILPGVLSLVLFVTLLTLFIQFVGLEPLQDIVESSGPLAPLAYISIKALTYIIAPLTSGPIQLSAGLLFGLWPGVLFTLTGEVLGGCVNFVIARLFGKRVVWRLVGEQGMLRVDRLYASVGGWRGLAYSRLFLFAIYDFMSYAAGLTRMQLPTYVVVSVVFGFVPTFLAVWLGTFLVLEPPLVLLAYGLVAVASVLPFLFQRRLRRLFGLAHQPVDGQGPQP